MKNKVLAEATDFLIFFACYVIGGSLMELPLGSMSLKQIFGIAFVSLGGRMAYQAKLTIRSLP